MSDEQHVTTARELAESLGVTLSDIIRAGMLGGMSIWVDMPLTEDDVEYLKKLLTLPQPPLS